MYTLFIPITRVPNHPKNTVNPNHPKTLSNWHSLSQRDNIEKLQSQTLFEAGFINSF